MNRKNITFIADFFKDEINGGAESNDSVLLSHLQSVGYKVRKIRSGHVGKEALDEMANDLIIIGNFIGLKESSKKHIANNNEYIIYEHDWKFLKTRDPSKFVDFNAPDDQIINREFYTKAKAVVVLSDICKKITEKTLGINNVYNIGTSLWSDEKFSLIEEISVIEKEYEYSVLNSTNRIKGRDEALAWCKDKGLPTPVMISGSEEEFLNELAKTKKLVFMPQVLETFCRVTCEAKMLGCKLITKSKMLGFSSELCWNVSGEDLIKEMRRRVENALSLFEVLIEKESEQGDGDITAILTCYKRPHLLKEQIKSLQAQSVPPKEIWVWINEPDSHSFDYSEIKREIGILGVKIFDCNHNWKFFGRFAAAMLARTEYVALYDDDTIPASGWHQNCLDTMKTHPGILGGVGCLISGNKYYGHERLGWSTPNLKVKEVDLVGHAWFLKKKDLKYLWMEEPVTWENGEDIHLSYTAQKYGNVKTYVPPHRTPKEFSSTKGVEYGTDDSATSHSRNHKVFYSQRDKCVAKNIENGWKTVRSKR